MRNHAIGHPARRALRTRAAGMFLAALVVAGVAAPGTAGAIALRLTAAQLRAAATRVVLVEVRSAAGRRVMRGTRSEIDTDVRLRVLRTYKGPASGEIALTQRGGRLGDQVTMIDEAPVLEAGQAALLYLGPTGWYVGGSQGRVLVDPALAAKRPPLAELERAAGVPRGRPAGIEETIVVDRAALAGVIAPSLSPLATNQVAPLATVSPAALTVPFADGFESGMGNWTVQDRGTYGPVGTWGATTQRHAGTTGTASVYCVQTRVPAPGPYPSWADARMFAGPFDLSATRSAWLDLDTYRAFPVGNDANYVLNPGDYLAVYWSIDGTEFKFDRLWDTSTGSWRREVADLRGVNYGGATLDLTGRSQVWLLLRFWSGPLTAAEGVYVDDVRIRTSLDGSVTPYSAPTGTQVAINGSGFGTSRATGGVDFYWQGFGPPPNPPVYASWSDTRVVCTIPERSGSDVVTVRASGGTRSFADIDVPYGTTDGRDRWSVLTQRYRVNPNCADLTAERTLALARDGAEMWNGLSGLSFSYDGTSTLSSAFPTPDSTIDVGWATDFPPEYAGYVLAWNTLNYSGGAMNYSDVSFNDAAFIWGDGTGGTMDVRSILTHELGHSLVLFDQYGAGDQHKIMYGYASGTEQGKRPSPDDVAGAVSLYGPGSMPYGSFVLDGGAAYAGTRTVSADASVARAATMAYRVDGSWLATAPYAEQMTLTLPAVDGTHTVVGRFASADGWAIVDTDTIVLDGAAPAGSFTLGVSDPTSATLVPIHSAMTDFMLRDMRIAVDGGAPGAWFPYAAAVTVAVPAVDGTHTISCAYSDAAGHVTTPPVQAFRLDRTPPVAAPVVLDGGATSTASAVVTATSSVTDSSSLSLRFDAGAGFGPWVPYAADATVSLVGNPGTRTVVAQYRDAAGNATETSGAIVQLTDTRPSSVVRVWGSDRYASAAAIARMAFPGYRGIRDVVVASGLDARASDPLAAAGLSGLYRAPILLVDGSRTDRRLPGATASALAAIAAANPSGVTVHVVGGTVSVPAWAMSRIDAMARIVCRDRVAGADRYATSVAIAQRIRAVRAARGLAQPEACLVTNGESPSWFFNALAAAPVSAARVYPVLLTKATGTPSAVRTEALRYAARHVVGSAAAVSAAQASALAATRIGASSTRAGVAAGVAATARERGWLADSHVGVANRLPDALGGGAALGLMGGPLLFSDTNALPVPTTGYLTARRPWIDTGHVLGGAASISSIAYAQVRAALGLP